MPKHETSHQQFSVVDPRTFDGDPFDVAGRACLQAEAVARVLADCIDATAIMARNAQLERNLLDTPSDARASEWEDDPQSRRFNALFAETKRIEQGLSALRRAASYNPRRPPKE